MAAPTYTAAQIRKMIDQYIGDIEREAQRQGVPELGRQAGVALRGFATVVTRIDDEGGLR